MTTIRVSFRNTDAGDEEPIELEALDVATALTIADINVGRGRAELRDGERVIARLVKQGGAHATFWQVN